MYALQSDEGVFPFDQIKRAEYTSGAGRKTGTGCSWIFISKGNAWLPKSVLKKIRRLFGIALGGIVCCVLEEVVASHLYQLGHAAMTADLQVRFKQPVPLEEPIRFSSEVEDISKRLWKTAAEARLPSGEVIVTARAKFLPARFELNGDSFDYEKKQTRE